MKKLCEVCNPECVEDLIKGEANKILTTLVTEGKKFDCILMQNILEYVRDPLRLLKSCSQLMKQESVLIIEVPNDFSIVQKELYDNNYISDKFWVTAPDHISYFNEEGLISICNEANLKVELIMGDFPIDFNLFNKETNYVEENSKGKACHWARVRIENLLDDISQEKTIELYEILADMGIGRSLIGFFVNN
jgi:2-polyprenyl-3-methyl-5-hydroxy-6-metoxy-1,4-benzoquinol methylase